MPRLKYERRSRVSTVGSTISKPPGVIKPQRLEKLPTLSNGAKLPPGLSRVRPNRKTRFVLQGTNGHWLAPSDADQSMLYVNDPSNAQQWADGKAAQDKCREVSRIGWKCSVACITFVLNRHGVYDWLIESEQATATYLGRR